MGLLVLKHIFRPDLRERLPEVLALWYTMRQKAHALDYLEAVIRYVTSASPTIRVEDVRTAIEEMAPEGESLMGTIAQEWLQQGLQQGLQEGEQRGEQRGLRQGLLSGIRLALKLKFGMAGVALMSEIAQIEDVDALQTILDGIGLAATPDELRQLFPTPRPDGGDLSE